MKEPYADETPARRVAPLLLLLAVAIGLVLAAAAGLRHLWDTREAHELSGEPRHGIAPALETAPQQALDAYRAQKQAVLHGADWLDRDRQVARIPIEDAMKALADGADRPAATWARRLMGMDGEGAQHAGAVPRPAAAARALQDAGAAAAPAARGVR